MKTTKLEMGLMKLQAETPAESQAICGIIEMNSKLMPAAVVNNHGCRQVGKKYLNWCLIPDGHLDGTCRKKHLEGDGCDCLKDGIKAGLKKWGKLPWNYVFKRA
jgi:hypothetical protein